jgi:hypothetical protein
MGEILGKVKMVLTPVSSLSLSSWEERLTAHFLALPRAHHREEARRDWRVKDTMMGTGSAAV